jgi:hypothetical protein
MVQGTIEPNRIFQAATSRAPPPAASLSKSALTAKYPVNEYFGNGPDSSYWVGCSTGICGPRLSSDAGSEKNA